jgi:iron(II)-dependent oxidoreductase
MVLQHEYQHNETILQTLQLKQGQPYRAPRENSAHAGTGRVLDGMTHVPEGTYTIGTTDTSAAYDNERPLHEVHLDAFSIDRAPVTNGQYMAFIADGGYSDSRYWSSAGRAWLDESKIKAPKYWERTADGWTSRTMDLTSLVDPSRPVCHVGFYEAEAFATWAGKRLPTEAEWEVAASWDPSTSSARVYPWGERFTKGDANIDQLSFDTAPIGSYEQNYSPLGCYGMIGDVWEWTSSDFTGYPGFKSFPYEEYSETFFGSDYKVLRGGSWATRPGAIRNSFRNWDYPIRRQIFSGFRCARSI